MSLCAFGRRTRNRTAVAVLILVGTASAACGGGPSARPAASSVHLPRVYSQGCPGQNPAVTKPSEMTISCADGNRYLSNIYWSAWTSKYAFGSAVYHANDCKPDCASWTFHTYTTGVALTHPVPTRTQGLVFATITTNLPVDPGNLSGTEDIGPASCRNNPQLRYC
jgi:hypothetical protein